MEETSRNKKNNKKITKTQFKKKLIKFVFVFLLVLSGIAIFIHNHVNKELNIYEKIGTMSPYSVSISDAYFVKGYGLSQYTSMIQSGDTIGAYNMLTDEYKKIVEYEEFLQNIKDIDFDTFYVKQVKMKSVNTYVATVEYEKNDVKIEELYLLYLNQVNPKIITMSPDKFIYNFSDLKFKMDNVQLTLNSCDIFIDRIIMNVKIKNTSWFNTMKFSDIGVGYNDSANKSEKIELVLAPGEEKELEITYSSNYYVPNNIKLKRKLDNETTRTYTFYLENEK